MHLYFLDNKTKRGIMNQPNIYAHGGNLDLRTDRQRVLWLILFIFLSINLINCNLVMV